MQINNIQCYDNTPFKAKLRIINKFFNTATLNKFNEKAQLIGEEKDIIELRYTNFRDKYTDITEPNQLNTKLKNVSDIFRAKFIKKSENKELEKYTQELAADNHIDIWKQEELAANKYIDNLLEKFSK